MDDLTIILKSLYEDTDYLKKLDHINVLERDILQGNNLTNTCN